MKHGTQERTFGCTINLQQLRNDIEQRRATTLTMF